MEIPLEPLQHLGSDFHHESGFPTTHEDGSIMIEGHRFPRISGVICHDSPVEPGQDSEQKDQRSNPGFKPYSLLIESRELLEQVMFPFHHGAMNT